MNFELVIKVENYAPRLMGSRVIDTTDCLPNQTELSDSPEWSNVKTHTSGCNDDSEKEPCNVD